MHRISSIATSSSTAPSHLGQEEDEVVGQTDYILWPYTFQSTLLLILFILWMIIGVFVAREVLLVILDHRKKRRKPIRQKNYHGAYSVKRKRYIKDKNYEAVANGGHEIA